MILRFTVLAILTSSLHAQGFARTVWTSDQTTRALAPAGDWNADGMPDLLISDGVYLHVLSGLDATSIWTSVVWVGSNRRERGVTMTNDLNLDGTADIYTFGRGGVQAISGLDGSPIWDAYALETKSFVVAGDVNGDGPEDLLIANYAKFIAPAMFGEVKMLDGATGAEIWSISATDASGLGFSIAAMGDLNNDGIPDVVFTDTHGNGRIHAVSGADGASIWTQSNPVLTSTSMRTTTRLSSVNGDTVDDVVSLSSDENLTWTWVLSGTDGNFIQIDTRGPTGITDDNPTTSDVDRDGWPDLVTTDLWNSRVVIFDGRMARNVIANLQDPYAFAGRTSVGIGTNPSGFGLIAMFRPPPSGPFWFSLGDPPDQFADLVLMEVVTGVEPNALGFREQCPASHGNIPTIGFLGRPHVGELATVTVSDVPGGVSPFLMIGATRGPPFLDPLGGHGCNLLAQPTLVVSPTTTPTDTSVTFTPTPGLLGTTLYCQWAMIDPTVPRPLPMSFSNGLRIEIMP